MPVKISGPKIQRNDPIKFLGSGEITLDHLISPRLEDASQERISCDSDRRNLNTTNFYNIDSTSVIKDCTQIEGHFEASHEQHNRIMRLSPKVRSEVN